jgi:magnesium-transporting ATPase (P-type)
VGDIVMVSKDREFPADLLLLYAPREIIYVDTMNLDGETNLKEKSIFVKDFNLPKVLGIKGEILCDMPDDNLDHWDGNIRFQR